MYRKLLLVFALAGLAACENFPTFQQPLEPTVGQPSEGVTLDVTVGATDPSGVTVTQIDVISSQQTARRTNVLVMGPVEAPSEVAEYCLGLTDPQRLRCTFGDVDSVQFGVYGVPDLVRADYYLADQPRSLTKTPPWSD